MPFPWIDADNTRRTFDSFKEDGTNERETVAFAPGRFISMGEAIPCPIDGTPVAFPAGTNVAFIVIYGGDVRMREFGAPATATLGVPLTAGFTGEIRLSGGPSVAYLSFFGPKNGTTDVPEVWALPRKY